MKLLNEYEIHQTIYNKGYRFNPQEELQVMYFVASKRVKKKL